jgi:hypothetical protein
VSREATVGGKRPPSRKRVVGLRRPRLCSSFLPCFLDCPPTHHSPAETWCIPLSPLRATPPDPPGHAARAQTIPVFVRRSRPVFGRFRGQRNSPPSGGRVGLDGKSDPLRSDAGHVRGRSGGTTEGRHCRSFAVVSPGTSGQTAAGKRAPMLGKWPIPNRLSEISAWARGLWIRRVLVRAQEGQCPG